VADKRFRCVRGMIIEILRRVRRPLLRGTLMMFARKARSLETLLEDARSWPEDHLELKEDRDFLVQKFIDFPEFRSLFYHRIGWDSVPLRILRLVFPGQSGLFFGTGPIGPGLYLDHSFATIISARSIGKNCQINQQVTIGHTEKGSPVIGDNVRIFAGALVFGDITVGNNAIIGAGSVVNKSVPPNCTVAGNPAKIIRVHASPDDANPDSVIRRRETILAP
jgi:serine O-acetyltransferase